MPNMNMSDDNMNYQEEHKDAGIIHFQGAIDTFNPDTDMGFTESSGVAPVYSEVSQLDASNVAEQQAIFNRLPLTSQSKAEFYRWLVTDYAEEEEAKEEAIRTRISNKKRKV